MLGACRADLGVSAPAWLRARDQTRKYLGRNASVNLLVRGSGVAWRGLIGHLAVDFPDLGVLDLEKPATASRRGLVAELLKVLGHAVRVPPEPEDLAELERSLATHPEPSHVALFHFDLAAHRAAYGLDFFAALRYIIMEQRKLVLLVQSRTPFATLLPKEHPLSALDINTVELTDRT